MNPVLADVYRNTLVESRHRGSVVAMNGHGETVFELGNIDDLVFPRSSLKPVQTIPLLETGAADHFGLSVEQIALACASHGAEKFHRITLLNWMEKTGLSPADLECGKSLPLHVDSAHQLLREGGQPDRLHHNCSGKHTGMLTLASFLDQPLVGYSRYEHEVQSRWMDVLTELSALEMRDMPWDRDGCGMPALAMPLRAFARSLASFCRLQDQSSKRAEAMKKILVSMNSYPEMVAGSGRCCTATMKVHKSLVVKTGAEGVFAAIAPDSGIAIALKIDDGATRAADVVLGAVLRKLGVLSDSQYDALQPWYNPVVENSQGVATGKILPSSVWH